MKILHTADWHIGKFLNGVSLIDEQYYALNEIINIAAEENVDAIIIAGDIYDRAVPPTEAVDLFNEVLTKLLLEKNMPVLCISGNHDSPTRLNFGTKILEKSNLFLHANLTKDLSPVILEDKFGKVAFSLIPFVDTAMIKNVFEDIETNSLADSFKILVDAAREKIPAGVRSVAVVHQFVAGSRDDVIKSDSERIFVGGSSNIPPIVFEGYDYVALGHLHAPQKIGRESVRYSGSPLKYSFDEATQKKGVEIVELDAEGKVELKFIPIKPAHDVRIIEGSFDDVLNGPKSDDYILVRLSDDLPVLNARDRLQRNFPNILAIERQFKESTLQGKTRSMDEVKRMSISELFDDYYFYFHDSHLTEQQKSIVESCMTDL